VVAERSASVMTQTVWACLGQVPVHAPDEELVGDEKPPEGVSLEAGANLKLE
jgi:hypothetical protein